MMSEGGVERGEGEVRSSCTSTSADEKRYLIDSASCLSNRRLRESTDSLDSQVPVSLGTEPSKAENVRIMPEKTSRNWFYVEVFQFIYLLGVYGTTVTSHALYMEKSCKLIHNYSEEICNNLTTAMPEYNPVQRQANNYSLYVTLLGLLPATIMSIFISNWSDKYGRKLPMIFAVVGILFLDVGFLVTGLVDTLPLYYIVIFAVPSGLSGGYLTINTCVYSLISEKSSTRSRTFQHAVMEVILLASIPLGIFIGGQLYDFNGKKYMPTFSYVVAVHAACILYAAVGFKESKSIGDTPLRTLVGDFFSFQNIKRSIKTCAKQRNNYGRARIWLLITSMCVTSLGYTVPSDQILYFFCNKMYGWGTTKYSDISTIVSVATIVTLSVSSAVFTKVFSVRDSILGMLGIVSLMAQNTSRSLADREWIFFTSVGLGVFAGFSDITVRSQISKMVSKDEMGQVFMLYSILVCSTPVVGSIAVTQIYNASLDFFPGLYFAIATVWLLYPLVVFVWIFYLEKRRP